jgi:fermentation-respiration switch protein FrsA (DUF1100 family)
MYEILPQLAISYALFAPKVAMPVYNTMIFYPYATGAYDLTAVNGIPYQDVFFPARNGKKLHGWYFSLPDASKTVLISHGNAGNLTYRAGLVKLLLQAGASVFVYDYRGYGKSTGSPSLKGLCEDADAAYNYLVEKMEVQPKDIITFGESIGSGAACELAANRPCGAIILQSAYTSLPTLAREKMPLVRMYPNWLFPGTKLDNLSILKQPHPPLLLVHGEKDELISISHSEKLYEQAVGTKYLTRLPDAGHNDIYDVNYDQYLQSLTEFIASLKQQ